MGIIEAIFPIIWCLIVFYIIFKAKKSKRRSSGRDGSQVSRVSGRTEAAVRMARSASNAAKKLYDSAPSGHKLNGEAIGKSGGLRFQSSSMMMEDRNHDWLARQLKEEAMVMRRGDFLDLGASHGASCDARFVKALHALQHDDSVDDGES